MTKTLLLVAIALATMSLTLKNIYQGANRKETESDRVSQASSIIKKMNNDLSKVTLVAGNTNDIKEILNETASKLKKIMPRKVVSHKAWTPIFHEICAKGNRKLLLLFINAGVDINTNIEKERTALMTAALYANHEIISTLLEHKPNLYITDSNGLNALHYTFKAQSNLGAVIQSQARWGLDSLGMLKSVQKSQQLICKAMGRNLSPKPEEAAYQIITEMSLDIYEAREQTPEKLEGNKPQVKKIQQQAFEKLKTALPKKIDISDQWKDIFYQACMDGNKDIIALFINAGIDVNDNLGREALASATIAGNTNTLKALIEYKADLTIKDHNENDILFYTSNEYQEDFMDENRLYSTPIREKAHAREGESYDKALQKCKEILNEAMEYQ